MRLEMDKALSKKEALEQQLRGVRLVSSKFLLAFMS